MRPLTRSLILLLVATSTIVSAMPAASALFGGAVVVRVPEPALGDEAVYVSWEEPSSQDGAKASDAREPTRAFTWASRISTVDRWGLAHEADLLREYHAGLSSDAGSKVTWFEAASAYAAGATVPLWTTSSYNHSFEFAYDGFLGTLGGGRQVSRTDANVTQYASEARFPTCNVRHALQGREVREGDTVPLATVCPMFATLAGQDEGLRIEPGPAQATEFKGRAAVALVYHVKFTQADAQPSGATGTTATQSVGGSNSVQAEAGVARPDQVTLRIVFADGLPYPARFEYEATLGEEAHRGVEELSAFKRGTGGPLLAASAAVAPEPATRPGAALAPITRAGPADGGSGFAYTLEDAVRNVEADLTLAQFQAWRAQHPGAILNYGDYRVQTTQTEAAALPPQKTAAWYLVFVGADGSSYSVSSEKTLGPQAPATPLGGLTSPVRNTDFGRGPEGLTYVAPADLPRQSIDFASAARAWKTHAPPSFADAAINHASYSIQSMEMDGRRIYLNYELRIGHAIAQNNRGDGYRSVEASFYATTGAADYVVDMTSRSGGYSFLPLGASSLPPAPARASSPFFGLGGGDGRIDFVETAVGASLLAALVAAIAYFKGWFTPLFTRLRRTEILDNELRRRLYERIGGEPGVHLNQLATETRAGNGAIVYHLNTMEREGLIRSVELPGYRRYFLTGATSHRAMRALAELKAGSAQVIYDTVRANPGINATEVAQRVGITPPAVHKTVERLVEVGLIHKTRAGKVVQLTAHEPGELN